MAKDPAFLFFPGDWLGGTMSFTRSHKGAYMDLLMCQFNQGHMALHDIKVVLGEIDFSGMWDTKLKAKFRADKDGLFYNEKLENEILKRKKYTESRRKNLKKDDSDMSPHTELHTPPHMMEHMENGDENIIRIIKYLETKKNISIGETEKKYFMFLVVEMARIFTEANPGYPFNKEADYSACLEIAYNIAALKKWTKSDVVNGKMKDCLADWKERVDFIKTDDWLVTRSLDDIATVKEWQRLVQKMNAKKKGTEKRMHL